MQIFTWIANLLRRPSTESVSLSRLRSCHSAPLPFSNYEEAVPRGIKFKSYSPFCRHHTPTPPPISLAVYIPPSWRGPQLCALWVAIVVSMPYCHIVSSEFDLSILGHSAPAPLVVVQKAACRHLKSWRRKWRKSAQDCSMILKVIQREFWYACFYFFFHANQILPPENVRWR